MRISDWSSDVCSSDLRVVNHGFYRTPHMYCYHINVGHPVLAQGSRYLAPIAETVWAAHAGDDYRRPGAGYRPLPAPQMNFHEQVWHNEMVADAAAIGRASGGARVCK